MNKMSSPFLNAKCLMFLFAVIFSTYGTESVSALEIESVTLNRTTPQYHSAMPQEIASIVLKSTVLIETQIGFGSGFVVDEGQVVTNHHVIENMVSGTVQLVGSTTKHTIAGVLAVDELRDLAIVKVSGLSAPSLPLGDSDTVEIGQDVYVAGNPAGLRGTFSTGIISAIRSEEDGSIAGELIQITAPISRGSSGGPVVDSNAEVIGIAVGGIDSGQNLNFAIPVNYLKELLTRRRTVLTVNIPDPNLRAEIENQLGKTSGAIITTADMETLTQLFATYANIRNLTGLAHATNLTELYLAGNFISDISPLQSLTNLTGLNLGGNSISDISPLQNLINLTDLDLGDNPISDISPLQNLINLTDLSLYDTSISDISPLQNLINLTGLDLGGNSISNISPLAGLNNLTWLLLAGNSISNISPLTNLTKLEELYLGFNSISDISPLIELTALTWLELSNNYITDISPLAQNTGLGSEDFVDVSENPLNSTSVNTHIPALKRRGVAVEAENIGPQPVNIPDPNLRRIIASAFGKGSGDPITTADMADFTSLRASGANITDLTGLEHATNLTHLDINDNSISDISPLENLTKLTDLELEHNSISDISPLTGLNNLATLILRDNSISDISPLAGLNNLEWLVLSKNSISDISPLVQNTGLGSGDSVHLSENPLNFASINTHIPALRRRGVSVRAEVLVTPEKANIPDPNLRAVIENELGKTSGATITMADMATLTELDARNANIRDLTGLQYGINLTDLNFGDVFVEAEDRFINSNSISDISPLAGLNKLTDLDLEGNSISDISPLEGLNNLFDLDLSDNSISDISPLENLTRLESLNITRNSISNISPLENLTKLNGLSLWNNSISDISPLEGLTNLVTLYLDNNFISDISPLEGLIDLENLSLGGNSISDISPLEGLNNLFDLYLSDNSISDILPLEGLNNLTYLSLYGNSISDISPLVANTGLGWGDEVDVSDNPLNHASINTHIPTLRRRGVEISFETLKPTPLEFLWSIPSGISLIHVPLKVTEVDGVAKTITSIGDLYDALGGASKVNFLITYDSQAQEWRSYFGTGTAAARRPLTDDMGVLAGMKAPTSVRLRGDALGTDGTSTITLTPGMNLVGLPLKDPRITRASDLFVLDGIGGNVPVIILTDGGEFKVVGRAGDPGDIEITGGQAFALNAQRAATVTISGDAWTTSGTAAAPPVTPEGIEVEDTTPVLGLRGAIINQEAGLKVEGFRVIVKNLSTGKAVAAATVPDESDYRLTVVDIETGRAATIGDTLEISAQSPNPFIGVKPLRHTITAEDVKQSHIQLPELVVYEIPAETELLTNYPNPFNPETWIPYRLAEGTFVTLTIYDGTGQIVRTLDVGHQVAAVYESRSKAIYWDGRNEIGEQVASGVYFYHLSAGDYSATRKMLILK